MHWDLHGNKTISLFVLSEHLNFESTQLHATEFQIQNYTRKINNCMQKQVYFATHFFFLLDRISTPT